MADGYESPPQVPQVLESIEHEFSFREKLGDVRNTFTETWRDASVWGRSVLGLAIGAQAYERLRIPEIIAPPIAVEVYLSTGSAAKTALTLGGLVAGQQFVIGATWAETLTKYGKVAEKVGEHFPKAVELAEDIGPAKERKWYSNIREGFAGYFTYGTTPFLIARKTYEPGLPRKDAHKTAARITTAIGIAGVAVGKALVEVVEELPAEYQDDAIRVLEKPYTWIALAAIIEVPRFVSKRFDRRKAARANKQGKVQSTEFES